MAGRTVIVESASRIHLGLIDLGGATRRAYGGVGFMIEKPRTRVVCRSGELKVVPSQYLDTDAMCEIEALLTRVSVAFPGIAGTLHVEAAPPSHVGFGTKTALLLSCVRALGELNQISLSPDEIRVLSRRGGASGIGVNGFFRGGWIFDGGHKANDGDWLPSSRRSDFKPPPVLVAPASPDDWHVHLMLPPGAKYSGEQEVALFRAATPMDEREVLRTLAAFYHGVLPAVIVRDLCLLRESLRDVASSGFKQRELAAQPASSALLSALACMDDLACGMSSLGPLVYAVGLRSGPTRLRLIKLAKAHQAEYIGGFSISADGHWLHRE